MFHFGNGSIPCNFINLNLVTDSTLMKCYLFLPCRSLETLHDHSVVVAGEHEPSVLSRQFQLPRMDISNYFGGAPFCSACIIS